MGRLGTRDSPNTPCLSSKIKAIMKKRKRRKRRREEDDDNCRNYYFIIILSNLNVCKLEL